MNNDSITFQCGNLPYGIKLNLRDKAPSLHEDTFTHITHIDIRWHKPQEKPTDMSVVLALVYYENDDRIELQTLSYSSSTKKFEAIDYDGLPITAPVIAWAYPPEVNVLSEKGDQEFLVEWY